MKTKNRLSLLILLIGSFCFLLIHLGPRIFAQTIDECRTIQECQELLKKYEAEISKYEQDINKTQQEKQTLKNQIYILGTKIEKLKLQIKESNLIVRDLGIQIGDTESSITVTSEKIESSKRQLAEVLRGIYEEDQMSIVEILLSSEEISDFFDNLVYLENLSFKNKELLKDIKNLKSDLEGQRIVLDQEKEEWGRMLKIQMLQKDGGEKAQLEQEELLAITKGKESEYQKLLTQSKEKAQKIRERLFELIGVPETPTFGQALEIAKYVERITGVRPAFLLAVLTQESNIGKNVGQCYLRNPTTGAGVGARNGNTLERVMHPTRDVPRFLEVCSELGKDPYNTLVSCPMSFGWGGAMGPAQFIPSTWALYKNKVSAITGKPANPWDIKDSFLAAGLLLKDAGAAQQTYEGEWRAAMVYFSGSTNSKYRFYGDSVMSIVKRYEDDIKQIEQFAFK